MNINASPEYLVCFKIYIQADLSALIVMGSTRLLLSANDVRALLDGVLDLRQTLASLHREINTTILEILSQTHHDLE